MPSKERWPTTISAAALGMFTVFVGGKSGGPADIKIKRIEELREILTLT